MSCLNPIRMRGVDGNWMSVPCGHCYGCMNQRSNYATTMCKLEALKHEYCFFLTLTYKPEYLPVVTLKQAVVCRAGTEPFEEFHFMLNQKRMKKFYACNEIDCLSPESNPYFDANEILAPFKDDKFKMVSPYDFGVLFRRDLINFFKRLRYHLNSKLNNNEKGKSVLLRYFGVGEYGPKTLRPHYHAVVFVDSQKVAEILRSCVHESWKYGLYDCQLSDTGKAIGYVAKYINSLSFVPKVLRFNWSKPFSIHSRYFGTSPDEDAYEKIGDLTYESVGERSFEIDGRVKSVTAPISLQSALFPKCHAYGISSDDLNLVRYRFSSLLYATFVGLEQKEPESTKELAEWYVDNQPLLGKYAINEIFCNSKTDDVVALVTSAIYLSDKFLRLCHRYSVSEWYYYYRVIKPWYADKDAHYLNASLEKMEFDFQISNVSPLNLVYRYGNLPRSNEVKYESMPFGILQSFADSIGVTVDEVVQANDHPENDSFLLWKYMQQCKIFRDNIKHKEQNDKNFLLYSSKEFYRLNSCLYEKEV